jgi:hypothetical protein
MSPARVSTKNKLSKFKEVKKEWAETHTSPLTANKVQNLMQSSPKLMSPPTNDSPVNYLNLTEMTEPSSPLLGPDQRRKFEPKVSVFAA